MKSVRFFIFCTLTLTSTLSFAATINCIDKRENNSLCTEVIDLSKLSYVNCLDEIGDGFEANLCANITIPAEDGSDMVFNCLENGKNTIDPYIIDRCSRLPNPNSVVTVNCWEVLDEGYENRLCFSVDTNEQESVRKKLSQQKF